MPFLGTTGGGSVKQYGGLANLGYFIKNSLRTRASASAYLNRTLTTPTSNQKMTLSCWVKIGSTSQTAGQVTLLNGGDGTQTNATNSFIQLRTDGTGLKLQILCNGGGAATVGGYRTFAPYLRDNSAWYHIVLAADTTQASAANRYRGYINGVEITSYTGTDPNQNVNITWLNTAVGHLIGRNNEGGGPFYGDTYITEMYWIDGQQLTPSSFGKTNAVTGVWKPKKYAGTYGTNGFYLNFSDNSAATATTIGKDYSGNGNNWTPNNISVTAGVTYDSMLDVPTPYADGGNGRGNYAVLNSLVSTDSSLTYASANLNVSGGGATLATRCSMSTISVSSGKWYAEVTVGTTNNAAYCGVIKPSNLGVSRDNCWNYYDGLIYPSAAGSFGTAVSGNIIGIAFDADNGTVQFYKNGSTNGAQQTGLTTGVDWAFYTEMGSGGQVQDWNFGQRPFAYTPPSGFKALNTQNLPEPTIKKGNAYFDVLTWTGTGGGSGATRSITGLNFQPDFVWEKARSSGSGHQLLDSVRGVGQNKVLASNSTGDEPEPANTESLYGWLSSLDSGGFTVTNGTSTFDNWNKSSDTYVGWTWKAGGAAVTNTSGTISSQVSANPTAGFSVVTYTANNTAGATIGHGLGVAPSFIIVKSRNNVNSWNCYHTSLGNTKGIDLNGTAVSSTSSLYWNNTSPTSSVFSVSTYTNNSTYTYVAYCFAAVEGYSKFGSFTGNNSLDGPFIYTGFKPAFIMIKRTDGPGSDWFMLDNQRPTFNVIGGGNGGMMAANQTYAESSLSSYAIADFLSNGVKIRSDMNIGYLNASGGTYIYMAFAEAPFKFSNGR